MQTYEAETIVDIFSNVSGWFTSVFYIMRFFIDPYIAWHMTKLIIENLYSQAGRGHGGGGFHDSDGFGHKSSQHTGGRPTTGHLRSAGHHPPYKDDRYIQSSGHPGGGHDPPLISKERLKVAGQLLKEKFDISKHMIHLYQIDKMQKVILHKLNIPIESMSTIQANFAQSFIEEVDEKFKY